MSHLSFDTRCVVIMVYLSFRNISNSPYKYLVPTWTCRFISTSIGVNNIR